MWWLRGMIGREIALIICMKIERLIKGGEMV
jgi:hypothetical protein